MNFEKMYSTIDTHVVGEAFRIVIQAPIAFLGTDILLNNDVLKNNFENAKKLLLYEPRGHRGINGCVVTPSYVADFGLLFFNHEKVSNFKYEGLFATVTALIETGNLEKNASDIYKVETVRGVYTLRLKIENQEVVSVYMESGICSEKKSDFDYVSVSVDNARNYLLYNLPHSIPTIDLQYLAELNRWGTEKIANLINDNIDFEGIILIESIPEYPNKVRSVTFEKDGYILRSPGIDSTFAILSSLSTNSEIENNSIFGSSLTAKKLSKGEHQFSIETQAFVTGAHEFIFDEDDPLRNGFLLV